MRKTIKVADMYERLQHILSNTNVTQAEKRVVCTLLETLLHSTGNYEGYQQLGSEEYNRYYMPSHAIANEVQMYANKRANTGTR